MTTLKFYRALETSFGHQLTSRQVQFQVHESEAPDSAFLYEFSVKEVEWPGTGLSNLKLQIFDESWAAFADHPELFTMLGELQAKGASEGAMEALLAALSAAGIEDITATL